MKARSNNPTQCEVRKTFDYDGQHLIRLSTGKKTGCLRKHGYVTLTFRGNTWYAHRLIFIWCHGYCPDVIDHINGIRSDNRIENLRHSDYSRNAANSWNPKGANPFRGVYRHRSKYVAEASKNGIKEYLGIFDTAEEAHRVFLDRKKELFADVFTAD